MLSSGQVKAGEMGVGAVEAAKEDEAKPSTVTGLLDAVETAYTVVTVVVVARANAVELTVWTSTTYALSVTCWTSHQ